MRKEIVTEIISKEKLYEYFEPEKVEGLCKSCPNYGRIWSCPPHSLNPDSFLDRYSYILLIGEKIYPDLEGNISSEIINSLFQESRRIFGDSLIDLTKKSYCNEERVDVLIAGNCYLCNICQREKNRPCIHLEKLKYSLESIGFLVGDITKEILGIQLQWMEEGQTPEYLLMVGAVVANQKRNLEKIRSQLIENI